MTETNGKLTDIEWTKKRIEEIAQSTKEVQSLRDRINKTNKDIDGVKGSIRWQNNRSKQANTIIERGF
tara:strand:+ start:272 stop:475 length:204 start_codon:yes stop_codon:yes gene_type:complete